MPDQIGKSATHLTAVTVSPFLMEIHELIDALLFRLDELDQLSAKWVRASDNSATLARTEQAADFDQDQFQATLAELGRIQAASFDAVEAFLAAWARLSLLFLPQRTAGAEGKNRGEVLQRILDVDVSTSPIADRDLRNAWMHFDERLDHAIKDGTWGNRHQFVRSPEGATAATRAVRLLEMDTLRVFYRDEKGQVRSTDLRALRSHIELIDAKRAAALQRFREQYTDESNTVERDR